MKKLIRLFAFLLTFLVPLIEYAASVRMDELHAPHKAQGVLMISDVHISMGESADAQQAVSLIESIEATDPKECLLIVEDISDIEPGTHGQEFYKNHPNDTLITITARNYEADQARRIVKTLDPLDLSRVSKLYNIEVNNIEFRQLIAYLSVSHQLDLLETICDEVSAYNDGQIANEYYAFTVKQAREACSVVHNHPHKDTIYALSYADFKNQYEYLNNMLFNARIDLFNSRMLHAIVTAEKPFVIVCAGAYHTDTVSKLLLQMGYTRRQVTGNTFERIHMDAGNNHCVPLSAQTLQTTATDFGDLCLTAHDWQERLHTVSTELPVQKSLVCNYMTPNTINIA